ncbi:hypothetical protein LJK87_49155 [Paenibacillus sp. P25]|nr:hypothetical protein LJK87_49155 [Paenibacillus sp. P25]
MEKHGVTDEAESDRLWLQTLGHPLALSLLVPSGLGIANQGQIPGRGAAWEELLALWLREARDHELRDLLQAASVPRSFNQEFLSLLAGREVPSQLFERLVRLSFIRRTGEGWRLHELIREAIRSDFRERAPAAFERCRGRAVQYYYDLIMQSADHRPDSPQKLAELLRLAGSPVMRAHFRHSRRSHYYLETVTESNLHEAEAYIRRREREARDFTIRCSDPESGSLFRFKLTAEESLLRLSALEAEELLRHGDGALKAAAQRGRKGCRFKRLCPRQPANFNLPAPLEGRRPLFPKPVPRQASSL